MPALKLEQIVEQAPVGQPIPDDCRGENLKGEYTSKTVQLPFEDCAVSAQERIASMGLTLLNDKNRMLVEMVEFGSPAEAAGIDFDWEIRSAVVDSD